MKKMMLAIMAAISFSIAQGPENVVVRNFAINTFKADSLKYTPWFNIADLSYMTIVAKFDDPAAGFINDSCNFLYALQLGNLCYNSSGGYDTCAVGLPIIIDSVNTVVSAQYKGTGIRTRLATDGTYVDSLAAIDSTLCNGYATNAHSIAPAPACFGRIQVKGGSQNNISAFLSMGIDVVQFKGARVNTKENPNANP